MRALLCLLLAGCSGAGYMPLVGGEEPCHRMVDAWREKATACGVDTNGENWRAAGDRCERAIDWKMDEGACLRALDAESCDEVLAHPVAPAECFINLLPG